MLKPKELRVSAVPGTLVSFPAAARHGQMIRYVGRSFDPKGDVSDLESEFPISSGDMVPNIASMRQAVAAGELKAEDEESAKACGLKLAVKPLAKTQMKSEGV